MLIVGAGGFARELLEIFQQKGIADQVGFYDDVNQNTGKLLFDRFPILKNEAQAKDFFSAHGNAFTIGIGNPALRYKMHQKFEGLGGKLNSVISSKACLGSFDVSIGEGCNILDGATFSNSTSAGIGCIVYYNSIITHDCSLGKFAQLSPGATLLGGAKVDDFTVVGSNATILPNVTVGKHAMIGAASVVTKHIPDFALMIGNPARRMGWVSEFGYKLLFDKTGFATCEYSGDKYFLEQDKVVKI